MISLDLGSNNSVFASGLGFFGEAGKDRRCWKYYFNVMCGTHVFGQEPSYLGH